MHSKILLYFAIYSFLGWCVESIYKSILDKKLVNSGFLYGPFCPIYAFGAIIMALILTKLPNNVFIIFISSTILLTVWEYIVGVLLEKIFKTKYWDYSHLKFNINGRVCLKNSIYWGLLGVAFTFVIHPFIKQYVDMIPEKTLMYVNIVVYTVLITDVVISVTRILFIDKKIQQIHEIGDKIKEKINELKQQDIMGKVSNESITLAITQLKKQQAVLKIKLYKLIIRLKRAFPTMQSETISKFINQKIDLTNIRRKLRSK